MENDRRIYVLFKGLKVFLGVPQNGFASCLATVPPRILRQAFRCNLSLRGTKQSKHGTVLRNDRISTAILHVAET